MVIRPSACAAVTAAVTSVAAVVLAGEGWQVHPASPVMTAGGSTWDAVAVGQPCVRFEDGRYRMWYVGAAADLRGRILLAESSDGLHWSRRDDPALDVGAAGSWDGWTLDTPEVVSAPDGWFLYYFGQRAEAAPEGSSIGLATSGDGVTFERHPAGAVLGPGPPGSWDERWVESPAVHRDPVTGRWIMLYSGLDVAWRAGVGLATSMDGVHWTKHPDNPVVAPSPGPAWDDYWAGVPALLVRPGPLWMLYSGVSEADLADGRADDPALGVAWSVAGVVWQRPDVEPVLHGVWAPTVVCDRRGGELLLWFETPAGIALATGPIPTAYRRPPAAVRVAP